MSELSPRAKAFLQAHRDVGTPTAQDEARVRSALKLALYGTAAVSTAPIVARLGLVKAGVLSTLVGVASVTTVVAVRSAMRAPTAKTRQVSTERVLPPQIAPTATPATQEAPPAAPAPVVHSVTETPRRVEGAAPPAKPPSQPVLSAPPPDARDTHGNESSTPALEPSAVNEQTPPLATNRVSPVVDTPPPPPPLPPTPSFDEELRLVEDAQAALRRGDPVAALEVLTRRSEAFGNTGRLEEEASAARIVALCLGGYPEAMAERVLFFEAHPKSLQRDRIERACAARR